MAFTLCTLNCNGIRAAHRKGLLAWLARSRPDVLCLQELRAWPEQLKPAQRCPEGYNTRQVNARKKGYAGVALWSRPPVDAYAPHCGLDDLDAEGRVLTASFGDLRVVCLYLPSGSSGPHKQERKERFMAHFAPWCRELLSDGRPTLICGDFNIARTELDIHDPRGNAKNSGFLPHERAWLTDLLAQGWVDVVRELHPDRKGPYTWWSNRGRARELDRGWRIDLVLATLDLAALAREAWVDREAGLSDHAPVFVRFDGDLYRDGEVGWFPP